MTQRLRSPELDLAERVLREAEVAKVTGLSRWTRRRLIARGEFPPSVRLTQTGSARGWLYSDIQAWLRQRIAQR